MIELSQTDATQAMREHGSVRAAAAALGTTGYHIRKALKGTANVVFTATAEERELVRIVWTHTRRRRGRIEGASTEDVAAALKLKERGARARIQRARLKHYIETTGTTRAARHTITLLGRKVLRLPNAPQKEAHD